MRRREFLTLLGGAAAWPAATAAQQRAVPLVGWLNSSSLDKSLHLVKVFRQGLNDVGLIENRDVMVDYQWADGRYDRLPILATELVRRQVGVIVAGGPPAALAAKAASATIPIVFTSGLDPIRLGLVESLSRPGGNLTGMSILNVELGPKRLELLHELLPDAQVVAVLINPTYPNAESDPNELQSAARVLGLQLQMVRASTESDIELVFEKLRQFQARSLLISNDPFLNAQGERLATLALRNGIATISQYREIAAAGMLMSYGGDIKDVYRGAGRYAGRIIKGEKPADLPVQQSTRIELVVNIKTAKALGLTVPQSILLRADEVIE
jgi:putative ABC transport system substrate-binding protein